VFCSEGSGSCTIPLHKACREPAQIRASRTDASSRLCKLSCSRLGAATEGEQERHLRSVALAEGRRFGHGKTSPSRSAARSAGELTH
jgi:hypothetical protein